MKIRLSELRQIIKSVIKEQNLLPPAPQATDNSKFFESYSQKMAAYLKGKTFQTVAYPNWEGTGNPYHPTIKFLGYGDRKHSDDNKRLSDIKEWDMMFKIQIVKSEGLPNAKDGQMGYVSLDFTYNKGIMTGISDAKLWTQDVKHLAALRGWTAEDLGGFRQWALVVN